jgi:hypothetical protein
MALAPVLAALVDAGVANVRGDREASAAALATAEQSAVAAEMRLHAAVARRWRGAVVGGDEGCRMVESGDAFLRAEGIAMPEKMAAALVPGFS